MIFQHNSISFDSFNQVDEYGEKGAVLVNEGIMQYRIGEPAKAINSFKKAEQLVQSYLGKAKIYIYLSVCYYSIGNASLAQDHIDKAMKCCFRVEDFVNDNKKNYPPGWMDIYTQVSRSEVFLIDSDPEGAGIYVCNGSIEEEEVTPHSINLPAGRNKIILKKIGYRDKEVFIDVEPGSKRSETYVLTPLPKAELKITWTLKAKPYIVEVGGKSYQLGPPQPNKIDVSVGTHKIKCVSENYGEIEKIVTVAEDRSNSVHFNFEECRYDVSSFPPVEILVNNEVEEFPPVIRKWVQEGEHVISFILKEGLRIDIFDRIEKEKRKAIHLTVEDYEINNKTLASINKNIEISKNDMILIETNDEIDFFLNEKEIQNLPLLELIDIQVSPNQLHELDFYLLKPNGNYKITIIFKRNNEIVPHRIIISLRNYNL